MATNGSVTDEALRANEDYASNFAFGDLETNVRQQIPRVKSHPWIPSHIPVRGFIYDVRTGRLQEVQAEAFEQAQSYAAAS